MICAGRAAPSASPRTDIIGHSRRIAAIAAEDERQLWDGFETPGIKIEQQRVDGLEDEPARRWIDQERSSRPASQRPSLACARAHPGGIGGGGGVERTIKFRSRAGEPLSSAHKIDAGNKIPSRNPSAAAFPAAQICQTAQRDQTTIRYNRGPSDDDRSPAILGSAHIAPSA